MKAIINGLLYDTEKADCIGTYKNKYLDTSGVYRTKNNRVFVYTAEGEFIVEENQVKEIMGKYCPDKYIELFGEVEEA